MYILYVFWVATNMKQKFEKSEVFDIVGVLDTNESGERVITVETKETFNSYSVEAILNALAGKEIEIKSVSSVDEV